MAICRYTSGWISLLAILTVQTQLYAHEVHGESGVQKSKTYSPVQSPVFKKKYIFNRRTPTHGAISSKQRARYPEGVTHASQWLGGVMKDMFLLNKNLIAWDSFAIMASMFPFFIGS